MASMSRIGLCFEPLRHFHLQQLFRIGSLEFSRSWFHTTRPRCVVELKMPSLSPTMSEGTIIKWLKHEGEPVNAGDILCEIQTDKAVIAFETEEEGILAKIFLGDDTKDVKVGTLVAVMAEPGEDWKKVQYSTQPSAQASPPQTEVQKESGSPVQQSESHTPKHHSRRLTLLGPAVRSLMDTYGVNASSVEPTGPQGLIVKGDILKYIEKENLKPLPLAAHHAVAAQPVKPDIKVREEPQPAEVATGKATKVVAGAPVDQEFEDIELTSMRRTIAKRLTQSKTGIPHAYGTVDCRLDSVLSLRKRFKSDGINLSINDVVIKAAATALLLCPDVNVIWKADEVVTCSSVDISIAVATKSGLITPIIVDAAGLGLTEIGDRVRQLADRARLGKLELREFQGGSFTISNLGMYGVSEFSAIINPPQCAILAVGASRLVLNQGKPETVMSATLSYDQSAVTPTSAAKFMNTFKSLMESPNALMLGHVPTSSGQQQLHAAC